MHISIFSLGWRSLLRDLRTGGLRLMFAAVALAVACKVSAALLIVPAALAWLIHAARPTRVPRARAVSSLVAHGALCAFAGLVTLRRPVSRSGA